MERDQESHLPVHDGMVGAGVKFERVRRSGRKAVNVANDVIKKGPIHDRMGPFLFGFGRLQLCRLA